MREVTFGIEELPGVAQNLLAAGAGLNVWLFHGEMGAGKTTLIKEICKALGVTSVMTSPTFSIVNEYAGSNGTIYHFDFYRLKREEEAFDIGAEEYLDSGNYCFVEWPDRIPSLVPPQRFEINVVMDGPNTRRLDYQRYE